MKKSKLITLTLAAAVLLTSKTFFASECNFDYQTLKSWGSRPFYTAAIRCSGDKKNLVNTTSFTLAMMGILSFIKLEDPNKEPFERMYSAIHEATYESLKEFKSYGNEKESCLQIITVGDYKKSRPINLKKTLKIGKHEYKDTKRKGRNSKSYNGRRGKGKH